VFGSIEFSVIRNSTLGCAYTQLISSFSEAAQDHVNLADGLDAQVVNALKTVEKGHEEAKKKVHPFRVPPFYHLTPNIHSSK
jgi:hypothetical protein